MSKIFLVLRFSQKGERWQVLSAGHRKVGLEVLILVSNWVIICRVLRAGVDHASVVLSIVGEKLTEARESKFSLQPFSFINQTLHLPTKYSSLICKWLFPNNTWQSSKGETPVVLTSWQEWYFSSSFWIMYVKDLMYLFSNKVG